jgi:hypothetical protein
MYGAAIKVISLWTVLAVTGVVIAAWAVSTRAMASAHLGFSLQWQLTPHDFAFAVAMRGDQPYAVGNFGILRGMPDGRDRTWARETPAWEQVADTGGEALLGIGFSPDGAGVAAGQLGLMLGAAADSDNWQPIESAERRRLFAVAASEKGAFLVAGELGTLLYRAPGAKQFVTVKTAWKGFDAPNLYDATFASPDTAIVVGESGQIVTVTNGVINAALETGPESLYGIARCGDGLYAVGQEGVVKIKLSRGGWRASRVPGAPDLYGLACIQNASLAAVGAGSFYLTNGLGNQPSWRQVTPRAVQVPWFSGVTARSADPALLLSGPGGLWEARLSDGE